MGRPRVYNSTAERVAAYRQRRAQREVAAALDALEQQQQELTAARAAYLETLRSMRDSVDRSDLLPDVAARQLAILDMAYCAFRRDYERTIDEFRRRVSMISLSGRRAVDSLEFIS